MEPTTALYRAGSIESETPFRVPPSFAATAVHPPLALSRDAVLEEERARKARDIACRVLNVGVAALLLLVLLPVMVLIAIAVKLSSPGPVIYVQDRVGLDRRRSRQRIEDDTRRVDRGGRIFRIYKFRTMRPAGQAAPQVWASEDDPRVTRIGRVLRLYRLDELPQLLNVLKGDMNLVGPRPEQPEIFESLRHEVASYARRQTVLPGITGWAQVNHGYDQSVDDVKTKLRYDLEYVQRRGLMEDLAIMAKTPPVMLFRQGSQ